MTSWWPTRTASTRSSSSEPASTPGPFRLNLSDRLRWFEIDLPGILGEEERVLGELGSVARCPRSVVAADLHGAWSEPLLDAGFDKGRRTAWIAEGLLFYLSAPVVAAVLAEARRLSGDGSVIGADVFGSGLLTLPAMRRSLSTRSGRGLPPPFVSDDPAWLFKAAGWPSVQLTFPGQLGIAYRPAVRSDRSAPRTSPSGKAELPGRRPHRRPSGHARRRHDRRPRVGLKSDLGSSSLGLVSLGRESGARSGPSRSGPCSS